MSIQYMYSKIPNTALPPSIPCPPEYHATIFHLFLFKYCKTPNTAPQIPSLPQYCVILLFCNRHSIGRFYCTYMVKTVCDIISHVPGPCPQQALN